MLQKGEVLPDIIFLDLNMPGMNGMQLLGHLQENSSFSSIPVVIYTTSKSAQHNIETKQLGAVHYIVKPINISELKKELNLVFTNV